VILLCAYGGVYKWFGSTVSSARCLNAAIYFVHGCDPHNSEYGYSTVPYVLDCGVKVL